MRAARFVSDGFCEPFLRAISLIGFICVRVRWSCGECLCFILGSCACSGILIYFLIMKIIDLTDEILAY